MHLRHPFFSFEVFAVPTRICFRAFVFNLFINDLWNVINHSKYLLFADDITAFHAVHFVDDCILLQSDTEHIQYWCTANCMKLNSSETRLLISLESKCSLLYL